MGLKSILSKPYARYMVKKTQWWKEKPVAAQQKVFETLIQEAKDTAFGKDHGFENIRSYEDFKAAVPVKDYEGLRTYVERSYNGEENVLWPGRPLYFCKTSGTTSGTKFIPISKESMPYHIQCAKEAILHYIAETGKAQFLKGKTIFIQGSPELSEHKGVPVGRLSGIVAHHVPWYLQIDNMPSHETNCIDDWEEKVEAIVQETLPKNMSLISGIPPWVQMYFERIIEKTGKQIKDVFPDFSLYIYGGVNFEPYKQGFKKLIGKEVDGVETYPASEGFIAYQDSQKEEGLLLALDHGIFYEFIPADNYFDEKPQRLSLAEVECGVDYAVIMNTNAGLWGYSIGDTVRFVSTEPYRLVVSGRIKHFTSAFGEHVIGKEVENALKQAVAEQSAEVNEFHVAPQVSPESGLPYHEWLIEFESQPSDLAAFADSIDKALQEQNTYYKDLIEGNVLRPLVITSVKKKGFIEYMKSIGKLGGQNKVPRLANDRKIADELRKF